MKSLILVVVLLVVCVGCTRLPAAAQAEVDSLTADIEALAQRLQALRDAGDDLTLGEGKEIVQAIAAKTAEVKRISSEHGLTTGAVIGGIVATLCRSALHLAATKIPALAPLLGFLLGGSTRKEPLPHS